MQFGVRDAKFIVQNYLGFHFGWFWRRFRWNGRSRSGIFLVFLFVVVEISFSEMFVLWFVLVEQIFAADWFVLVGTVFEEICFQLNHLRYVIFSSWFNGIDVSQWLWSYECNCRCMDTTMCWWPKWGYTPRWYLQKHCRILRIGCYQYALHAYSSLVICCLNFIYMEINC